MTPRLNLNTMLDILVGLKELYLTNPWLAQVRIVEVIDYLKKVKEENKDDVQS